jgi:hypothetical protein
MGHAPDYSRQPSGLDPGSRACLRLTRWRQSAFRGGPCRKESTSWVSDTAESTISRSFLTCQGRMKKSTRTAWKFIRGGVIGNNPTQVARLGATAGWLGLISDDENGRLITRPSLTTGWISRAQNSSTVSDRRLPGFPWMRRASAASICSGQYHLPTCVKRFWVARVWPGGVIFATSFEKAVF